MIPRTIFNEEHELFRESARRFVEKEIEPYYDQWERDGQVSREVWRAAGEHGLLCCSMPEEYGGPGADFLFSMIFMEELCRANTTGAGFHLHSEIVAPYILKFGTEEQRQRWLPRMVRGELIGAIAMTEPGAGSDLQGIKTFAERSNEGYTVTGQKVFITNGQLADLVIVACKTDREAGTRSMSLIVLERGMDGFDRGRNLEKIGWHAQDTSELFFDHVRVPHANLLGEEGRGFHQLMDQLAQERLIVAVRSIATVEAALEWTIEYVNERHAFGRPIAGFQNTRFKLAEVKSEAVMQRVFVDRCMQQLLAGELDAVDAAIAKLRTTEFMGRALDECLQLFGGYGYMKEYPIARAWADHRYARIAGGSSEIMKEIIGRQLTGQR